MSAELFTVQPTYRGDYIVVGPNTLRKCAGFCEAVALCRELNENHARTQAVALRVVAEHFPRGACGERKP